MSRRLSADELSQITSEREALAVILAELADQIDASGDERLKSSAADVIGLHAGHARRQLNPRAGAR